MFNNIPQDDFYQYADNLDPERQQGAVIKRRLEELRGDQTAGFYRPDKPVRVTTVDSEHTVSGDRLETVGCIHCDASYGHTINCPTWNREAAEDIASSDAFFLKSLRISTN